MKLLKDVHTGPSEKDVEAYLCKKVKSLKGIPYKFTSPARRAAPDRLCVFPYSTIAFVEVKRPGKRPTPLQQKELNDLKNLGHIAVWVDSKEAVNHFIRLVGQLIAMNRQHMLNVRESGEIDEVNRVANARAIINSKELCE